ncbi:MAG TPA: inositol-3-phosphate synthase, partial [Methylocystis sp.]
MGNCASSLVQGIAYYGQTPFGGAIPGLMTPDLGGYGVGDMEICAAFDVNATKVDRDVSEAIHGAPNNTHIFADVPPAGVRVSRGPTLDGIGQYLADVIEESDAPVCDVARVLRASGADVLICYLPVGSQRAAEWYMEQALAAGCGVVNCLPVFIASRPDWRAKFEAHGLPIIGDDIKSQVGATIVHRVLANLFAERGVKLDRTYQLNVGGNADFQNMLERERLVSK